MDYKVLIDHLELTKDKFDVTQIYDRSGYSPLHFGAYKNSEQICEILCDFVLQRNNSNLDEEQKQ